MTDVRLTGGCQCGAIRYALLTIPAKPCICHCRMCQKQFGNYFGAFATMENKELALTRGEISWWRSSEDVERGFCKDCGTPLAFRRDSQPRISLALGSLDRPEVVRPVVQYGAESMMPWWRELAALPATVAGTGDIAERYETVRTTSRQHPDHDTRVWPPQSDESLGGAAGGQSK